METLRQRFEAQTSRRAIDNPIKRVKYEAEPGRLSKAERTLVQVGACVCVCVCWETYVFTYLPTYLPTYIPTH